MSEQRVQDPEFEPVATLIASGLSSWLMREVGSSTTGRNHFLDEFDDFRTQLSLPYEAPGNNDAEKNRSHFNRLEEWTTGLSDHYFDMRPEQKDYAMARQILCAQMYLSGLFRIQCHMQATDQDDYYRRRLEGAHTGIDLGAAVADRLPLLFGVNPPKPDGGVSSAWLSFNELVGQTLTLNEVQRKFIKLLHATGVNDVGQEQSPTIAAGANLQKAWTGLVVDYIGYVAAERGNLRAVPFLEPKSMTEDPQVYYPFAQAA